MNRGGERGPAGRGVADPLERFSGRAENYARYRPGYPAAVIELLRRCCGLGPAAVAADLGAGTGLFTERLLESGATVVAVEPNPAMRAAAQDRLAGHPRLRWSDGRAEATGLPSAGCDLVAAAQAFHWFATAAARAEFIRILRPEGWAVLVWNWRKATGSPFLADYEALLRRFSRDYTQVAIEHWDQERISSFFPPGGCRRACFPNFQALDWTGLRGRLLSASYAPQPGEAGHEEMMAELNVLYQRHQQHDLVRLDYETRVYYGQLR